MDRIKQLTFLLFQTNPDSASIEGSASARLGSMSLGVQGDDDLDPDEMDYDDEARPRGKGIYKNQQYQYFEMQQKKVT